MKALLACGAAAAAVVALFAQAEAPVAGGDPLLRDA
jgi:hypothetical protein